MAVSKRYSLFETKLIFYLLHLVLALAGGLHGVTQLGSRVLPLQLHVDLLHEIRPLASLASAATLGSSTTSPTRCHLILLSQVKIFSRPYDPEAFLDILPHSSCRGR